LCYPSSVDGAGYGEILAATSFAYFKTLFNLLAAVLNEYGKVLETLALGSAIWPRSSEEKGVWESIV